MVNPHPRYQDKQRYVRVKHDGSSCVCTAAGAEEFRQDATENGEPDCYEFEDVWMTPHQFESLPDFSGF